MSHSEHSIRQDFKKKNWQLRIKLEWWLCSVMKQEWWHWFTLSGWICQIHLARRQLCSSVQATVVQTDSILRGTAGNNGYGLYMKTSERSDWKQQWHLLKKSKLESICHWKNSKNGSESSSGRERCFRPSLERPHQEFDLPTGSVGDSALLLWLWLVKVSLW